MAELTETDRLCRQSIQKYLDVKGIPYERQGYYLRLRDHDSLVVDTRVTKEKPYETFYWNSQAVGGNLYNFLRSYEKMEAKEAFDELKKMAPERLKQRSMRLRPNHMSQKNGVAMLSMIRLKTIWLANGD